MTSKCHNNKDYMIQMFYVTYFFAECVANKQVFYPYIRLQLLQQLKITRCIQGLN